MDPRVKTSAVGLQQQFDLSLQVYFDIEQARRLSERVQREIASLEKTDPKGAKIAKLKLLLNGTPPKPGTSLELSEFPVSRLAGAFTQLLDLLQDADVAPSVQAVKAVDDLQRALIRAYDSLPPNDL